MNRRGLLKTILGAVGLALAWPARKLRGEPKVWCHYRADARDERGNLIDLSGNGRHLLVSEHDAWRADSIIELIVMDRDVA